MINLPELKRQNFRLWQDYIESLGQVAPEMIQWMEKAKGYLEDTNVLNPGVIPQEFLDRVKVK